MSKPVCMMRSKVGTMLSYHLSIFLPFLTLGRRCGTPNMEALDLCLDIQLWLVHLLAIPDNKVLPVRWLCVHVCVHVCVCVCVCVCVEESTAIDYRTYLGCARYTHKHMHNDHDYTTCTATELESIATAVHCACSMLKRPVGGPLQLIL